MSSVSEPFVLAAIEELLVQKIAGNELDDLPRNEVLHSFIVSELESLGDLEGVPHRKIATATLDELFRETVLD